MNLKQALKKLHLAKKRLADGQGRIARRNARRAFIGALQSLRHALDAEYPSIEKPKPVALLPKPPKPRLPKLERHPFRLKDAQLFADLSSDIYDLGGIRLYWSNAGVTTHGSERWWLSVGATLPDRRQWKQLLLNLRGLLPCLTHQEVADLYHKFWRELLPVNDLTLAARHYDFLEKHGVKA